MFAQFLVDTGAARRVVELSTYLDPAAGERAVCAANAWIKSLRQVQVDGRTLRDRFSYRGDSLWWFTELFLAKEKVVLSAFKTMAAIGALIERESPHSLKLVSGDRLTRAIAPQLAADRAITFDGPSGSRRVDPRWRTRASSLSHLGETLLARLHPTVAPPTEACDLAIFVHSAFWRAPDNTDEEPGGDSYIGQVIRELSGRVPPDRLRLVGIGPLTSYRARGRHGRLRRALVESPALPFTRLERYASLRSVLPSLRLWRQRNVIRRALLASGEIRRAAVVSGCNLWPVVRDELAGAATLQLPWSARAMDEVGAALDALRPRAVVTYAEAGGWGRALVLEGRRRGIPVIGLQHGFIYRHWLNYLHEPDEMRPSGSNPADRGFPLPDLTLVFDGHAAAHLAGAGHFPSRAVRITGSPQRDALVAAVARLTPEDIAATRRIIRARPDQPVVLIATKFSQVEPVLAALVKAIASMPDVCAVVKSHPAESTAVYDAAGRGASNLRILPPDADLAALLATARLVVTVNSTVAVDGLTLGIPALALAVPNNLSPFVEAGAMTGLPAHESIAPTLEKLLYDETWRAQLAANSRAFLARYNIRADGQAARRTADVIMATVNP